MIIPPIPPDDNSGSREGERLRDEAHDLQQRSYPGLIRHLQVLFIASLLKDGPATSDVVRGTVPIPKGIDPRVVGCAIQGLKKRGLIIAIGYRKSRRPVAHARLLAVWKIRDEVKARLWLARRRPRPA